MANRSTARQPARTATPQNLPRRTNAPRRPGAISGVAPSSSVAWRCSSRASTPRLITAKAMETTRRLCTGSGSRATTPTGLGAVPEVTMRPNP